MSAEFQRVGWIRHIGIVVILVYDLRLYEASRAQGLE